VKAMVSFLRIQNKFSVSFLVNKTTTHMEEEKDDENEISLIHHTLRQAQGEHRSTSFIIQVTDFFITLSKIIFGRDFSEK
jgi:hypothetical protein